MNGDGDLLQRIVRSRGDAQSLLGDGLGHFDGGIDLHAVIVVEAGDHNIEFTHNASLAMHLAGRLGQQGVHAGAGLFLGITTENLLGDTLSCGNIFQRGDLQVGFRTGDNGDGSSGR